MARRRFFVDEIARGVASIDGDDAGHLTRVLRVERGQKYELSDGARVYLAEVTLAAKSRVEFQVIEEIAAEAPAVRVHLYPALIKFDRFELMIEKATELGVNSVTPVAAARSDKGLDQAAAKRLERWRRIGREASQQSRRVELPRFADSVRLAAALRDAPGARIVLEERPGAPALAAYLPAPAGDVSVFLGPEGGWTDAEREAFAGAGVAPVSLGPSILRAETAAIAALTVLSHLAWSRPLVESNE